MREVEVSRLTDVIEKLCIEANEHLPEDVKCDSEWTKLVIKETKAIFASQ